jgi:hypothetical protein
MDNPIKKSRRTERVKVVQAVDTQTGEVLDSTIKRDTVEWYVSNEDFYMTYSSVLKILEGTTPLEGLLLQEMCFGSDFNKGTIHISSGLRTKWSEKFKCTKQSVSNALSGLKKKRLIVDLYEGSRGSFLINPKYFFRGDAKGRHQAYELMIQIVTRVENDKNKSV